MSDDAELLPADLESSPCLQGERVAFTGILASMTHHQACDLVVEHGGSSSVHVSGQVTMLVVGEEGWPLDEDGKASVKLEQAVELINAGSPLQILKESEWLRLLGLEHRERDVHRLFTPAMLQQKLSIPVGVVRRWERLGLIVPVQRLFRLPYFDFQEVAAVRRLQEMLKSGIPRDRIEQSLTGLRLLLPSVDRPLAQLEILAQDSRVVFRDQKGLVEARTGQRMLDFESRSVIDTPEASTNKVGDAGDFVESAADHGPATIPLPAFGIVAETCPDNWNAEEWFDHGCGLLGDGDVEESIEAFRMALMLCPDDAEIHFYLASALYRSGNPNGAMERYHVAVELDHEYIEAWTQLGCLRVEAGDDQGAVEAFDIALTVHADYPDAVYHKAAVLSELGCTDEAVALWKRYLEFDQDGPWADSVIERLEAVNAFEAVSPESVSFEMIDEDVST
ncbi:MAG: tetratricopeptide repeat protein [Rhodopirellula sp.]|nr:tetratricopeptide repeat protein [Rhodopirellula sp.]